MLYNIYSNFYLPLVVFTEVYVRGFASVILVVFAFVLTLLFAKASFHRPRFAVYLFWGEKAWHDT